MGGAGAYRPEHPPAPLADGTGNGAGVVTLRPYQQRIVDSTFTAFAWSDRVLVVAPTGAGKTVIAASIIERHLWATVPRRPVLFLAERLSLVDQARRELAAALPNVRIGVMQADRDAPGAVIVASQQTVESRGWPALVGLVVVDEAHIQRAEIMDGLPAGVPILGLTATPLAAGMAQHWQVMVSQVTTRELIDAGHLVDVEVLTHDETDLAAPVRQWVEHGEGRATIGFTESCEAAFTLADALPGAWEVCWHGDSRTERDVKIGGFKAGRLQGLLSVDALGRGLDVPAVSCLLACRPLRSLPTWLQQLGRVIRSAPGKRDARVLDCAGNWARLGGLVLDYWAQGPPPLRAQQQAGVAGGGGSGISPALANALLAGDAELVTAADPPPTLSAQDRLLWYAASTTDGDVETIYRELLTLAVRGRSPDPLKRAKASYRGVTGRWPRREWESLSPLPPSSGVQQAADLSYMDWRRRQRGKAAA